MNKEHSLLTRIYDILSQARVDEVGWAALVEEIQRIAEQHGVRARVLREEATAAGEIHVDVLLFSSAGVTSIAYVPHGCVPWPLRGARRLSDLEVVAVNGSIVSVHDVALYLDAMWEVPSLLTRIVDDRLLCDEALARGIVVDDDELDRHLHQFREQRGLLTRDEFAAWLRERGLDVEVLRAKLRGELTRNKVCDGFLSEYRGEGQDTAVPAELAVLLRCGPLALAEAEELAQACRDNREALLSAISKHLANDRELMVPLFAIRRDDLSSEQAQQVFSGKIGTIVGPMQNGSGWDVIEVLRFGAEKSGKDAASCVVLDRWLTEKRRAAKIEWNWGRGSLPGDDPPCPGPTLR